MLGLVEDVGLQPAQGRAGLDREVLDQERPGAA
jgi:hypothetical protein